jgi:recombination protein RecT
MTVIQMPEPGQELERRDSNQLARLITPDGIEQIARALPDGVTLARFDQALAIAMVKEPALEKADRTSLFLALIDAAKRGLMPDGKQGAIVVFKEKAQFLPMIDGIRDTLAEHGWMLVTSVVYENDEFTIDKAAGRARHRMALRDRGDVIGAYAQATHRSGTQHMADWMPLSEIDELVQKMGVGNNPAWKKWPNQMREKTVGHRLADDIPLAPQDRRRVEWIINATELGPEESAALMYGPDARASFGELPSGHIPHIDDEFTVPSEASAYPTEEAPAPTGAGASAQETAAPAEEAAVSPLPLTDEQEMLALDAAGYVPPKHRYSAEGDEGPLTLAEIFALPDDTGKKYLAMLLRQLKEPEEYVAAVHAFCRSAMPDVYKASLNQKAA